MNSKIIKDGMMINDGISSNKLHRSNLWARTRIIGGYDLRTDERGISSLGEVVFDTENLVPIGGVHYAMQMIFGTEGIIENSQIDKKITIPTLNAEKGIGAQTAILGKEVAGTTSPEGKNISMPYPYGQRVCLFGIGDQGASENNLTALEVKYNEWDVSHMIPFRYTNDALSDQDVSKYFGKKKEDDIIAYYLKRFDNEPQIYHFYKNGVEGEDGDEIDSDTIWTSMKGDTGIESFTECRLTISKKDVREWFDAHGEIENARVNSIGLFSAIYNPEEEDYSNIQLFSKLNIPTEPLSLMKDMNIIYRVYGA